MGRRTNRPATDTFKDLRSASVPKKRNQSRNKKYQNFTAVNPGQLDVLHYKHPSADGKDFNYGWETWPADMSECEVVKLSKKQFYIDAKNLEWPRRPCNCCTCRRYKAPQGRISKGANLEVVGRRGYGYHADYDEQAMDDVEYEFEMDAFDECWLDECAEHWSVPGTGMNGGFPNASCNIAPLIARKLQRLDEKVEKDKLEQLVWIDDADEWADASDADWADWEFCSGTDVSSDEHSEL